MAAWTTSERSALLPREPPRGNGRGSYSPGKHTPSFFPPDGLGWLILVNSYASDMLG